MPKARRYKERTKFRTNPIARDEAHSKVHEKVLNVVESLRSANEKDRKWSSAIITELVEDDQLRLTLLKEGVVNALLDRLTDDNMQVKHDAIESLDALVLKEGESLCKELCRKNILKLIERVFLDVRKSKYYLTLRLRTDLNLNVTKVNSKNLSFHSGRLSMHCLTTFGMFTFTTQLTLSEACREGREAVVRMPLFTLSLKDLMGTAIPLTLRVLIGAANVLLF